MRKPMLGYTMAPILLVLMSIAFGLLLCQYYTFGFYYNLFQTLFSNSLQEEKFLSEIEFNLDCILDEDEENTGAWVSVNMHSPHSSLVVPKLSVSCAGNTEN
jgi:membrane protein insertase Oxa1/YidC/SpoIIIJ